MRCGLERPPACVLRQLACPLYSALLISTANTIFEEGPQQPFMQTASPINTPFSGLSSDISISAEVPDGQAGACPHDAAIYPPSPGTSSNAAVSEGTDQQTKAPILGTAITPYRLFNVLVPFILLTIKFAESLKGEGFKLNVFDYSSGIVLLSMCVFLFTCIFKSLTILLRDVQSNCLGFWETDSRPSNFVFHFDIATSIADIATSIADNRRLVLTVYSLVMCVYMLVIVLLVNFAIAINILPHFPTNSFDLWTLFIDLLAVLAYV